MNDNASSVLVIRPAAPICNLVGAFAALMPAVAGMYQDYHKAFVWTLMGVGLLQLFRAIRDWGYPLVKITTDSLLVFDGRKLKQRLRVSEITDVQKMPKGTLLVLAGDSAVAVGKSQFIFTSDVQRFEETVRKIVTLNREHTNPPAAE